MVGWAKNTLLRAVPRPSPTPNVPPYWGAFGSTRKPPSVPLKLGVNSIARLSSPAGAVPLQPELDRDRARAREVHGSARGACDAVEVRRAVGIERWASGHAVGDVAGGRGVRGALRVGERRAARLVHPPVVDEPRRVEDGVAVARDAAVVHRHGNRCRRGLAAVVGHPQLDLAGARGGVGLRPRRAGAAVDLEAAVAVEVPLVLDDRSVGVAGRGPVEGHRLAHHRRVRRGGEGGGGRQVADHVDRPNGEVRRAAVVCDAQAYVARALGRIRAAGVRD